MSSYKELQEKHQKEVNEFPLGFAFSNKQFDEMMIGWGLKPTDTHLIYTLPWSGGFVQKKDSAAMHEMFDRHERERNQAIAEDKDGTGYIYEMFAYELANHEYGYTYDIEPTLDACGLSVEDVQKNEALKAGLCKALREYEGARSVEGVYE